MTHAMPARVATFPKAPSESGATGLTARVLTRCFLRSYLIGATFSSRGLQNVGLLHAIDPGLMAIHGPGKALRKARKRYLRHYNSHPFWAPLIVGMFLSLEVQIARGVMTSETFDKLRPTAAYALSALGDSLFGGSVGPFWSLTIGLLLLTGHPLAAILTAGLSVAAVQVFKLVAFLAGCRHGLAALKRLKALNLIDWAARLKMFNGALLALVWIASRPSQTPLAIWLSAAAGLSVLAIGAERTGIARELLVAGLLILYALRPDVTGFLDFFR